MQLQFLQQFRVPATLLFGFILQSISVFAVADNDTIAHHRNLKEVEVNAHDSRKLRSAMPTQVVTVTEIDKLNAANVADIAKHFAGVTIKDYGGIGGLKTISVRGLGAAHTGVSYDGLMMSDIQSGQIDLSQFCVENIAAVSLDNGQPMNLLQPARMFASSSVLSLQTKLPTYDSTHTFSGKAAFKTGSFGLVNPSVLLEKYFGKKLGMSFNTNAVFSDGKYPVNINVNPNGTNIQKIKRSNTDVKSVKSEFNLINNFRDSESVKFKFTHYYSDRGIPGAVIYYLLTPSSDRIMDNNFMYQLHYENKNRSDIQYQFSGKISNQHMEFSEVDNQYKLPNNTRIDKYKQNEYYLSAALQYRPVNNIAIGAAFDGWYNDLISESNYHFIGSNHPTRRSLLSNISAKYYTERFTLGGNLLYTLTNETADSTFAAPDRHKVSPTVFASLQLSESGNLLLRAFYKNIFRLPTFTELYYHNFGFKDLLPENTQQFNIGMTYFTNKISFLNNLSITSDVYYNLVNDKITIIYGMPFSTVRNIGLVRIKGCDINLSASKLLSNDNKVSLSTNYSFQLAQDFGNDPQTRGDIIPYSPIHSGSLSISYSFNKMEVGYNLLYAGKRYSGQNADPYNYVKPYSDHSIFCSYTLNKLKLSAEVLNFTNVNYEVVKSYPMPRINFRININYKF